MIRAKYAEMRQRLPMERGEVKGRLLNEAQVDNVVTMLRRNEALFEIAAIDLGFQSEAEVIEYKNQHAEEMPKRLDRFKEPDRTEVQEACKQIKSTSPPLYLQAMATFEVLKNVLDHAPLYFSQRQPDELATFRWVIDGKNPKKITDWEIWWSWYAVGALATMSRTRPQPILEGADLSYYERFKMTSGTEEGSDMRLLLSDLKFYSSIEPELELADIVVNATRRALVGRLRSLGFANISRLMIHRREPYIKFLLLKLNGLNAVRSPAYGGIVRRYFSSNGRSMLSPRFLQQARADGADVGR